MSLKANFSLGFSNTKHNSQLKVSGFANFFAKGGFEVSEHLKTSHWWDYQ